jgi:anti-sigma factor RsiW
VGIAHHFEYQSVTTRSAMTCQRTNQIQAYYDNELPVPARHEVEAHLRDCTDCRDLLAQLQGLSSLLSEVPLAEPRPGAIQRFENVGSRSWDRGILRIAGWLTATAAAVLLATVVNWSAGLHQQTAQTNDVLETVAFMPPADSPAENRSENMQLAQWMVDDLSPNDGSGLR